MFNLLFRSLSDLNSRTALLEACDWDEDRLEYVIQEIASVVGESPMLGLEKVTLDDIKSELRARLSDRLSESEILILSNILDNSYEEILKSEKENKYEN